MAEGNPFQSPDWFMQQSNDFGTSPMDNFDNGGLGFELFGQNDYQPPMIDTFDSYSFEAPIPPALSTDFDYIPPISHRRTCSSNLYVSKTTLPQPIPNVQFPNMNQHQHRSSAQPLPVVQALTDEDNEFKAVCQDRAITFNPQKLGFIPTKFWPDQDYTFGDLVTEFFQRKSHSNSRFSHKLYNALKISNSDPFYSMYLGVEWVTDRVLKVDKKAFARLLGVKTIDGSLFHQQGNFPSHGFVELKSTELSLYNIPPEALEGVDYDNVRLLVHTAGVFVKNCTEDSIERCRWISTRHR